MSKQPDIVHHWKSGKTTVGVSKAAKLYRLEEDAWVPHEIDAGDAKEVKLMVLQIARLGHRSRTYGSIFDKQSE